jgi:hypothetical protein
MCTASAAIESFKRCHLEAFLIAIIVRELSQQRTLVPTIPIVHHTCTEHVFQHMVYTLCLAVDLRVIS